MRQIIDKHYDNDEFKFEFAEGSNATLLVDVQSLGSADTNLSGYTAKLYYYDSVRDTSSYQITSDSLDAATGRFTFNIQPTDLAEYGAYLAELVIIDGSDNEFLQCFGNVIIKESILDAGTTAATTGPVLNYTVFSSFSGTKTSGPYTAGTNITFSDPDSNGRVAINSSGGGGATDLDDLTDVTITTPTELQALIYDGAEWVNGWPEVKMIQVRNDEGSTIPAGSPLYSKGEIGGSNRILVGIADASDSAKMPCIGIAYAEMNTSSTQDNYAVVGGVYNTELNGGFSGLNVGDTVYVKNWTGTPTSASDVLTTTRPTDGGVEVQNVGIILKTNGTIIQGLLVSAIGRSNDIPNAIVTTNSADADYVYIDDGNVWKKITPANLGISGNSLPFGTWDYDSDLGTPDAGQFSTNNATASSVTQIKIHDNNSDGVDVSGITDLFNAGDYLYIQESGDSSTSHLYQIDSRGLSFTGGQSFNVTHQSLSSNSTWTNGNACGIFYIHASETNDYLLDRANHTGTQTASTISDFDTEVSNNTDVTANTAKLTANEANVKSALDGATISSATVATGDKVLIQDVDDSDNLKTVTAQSIADLASGGGALPPLYKDWEGTRFSANGGPLGNGASPAPHSESGTNINLYGAAFDDSQVETAGPFRLRVPDSVDNTVDVEFHIRGFGGDTNNAKFRVQYATNGDNSLTNADSTFAVSTSKTAIAENTISVDMTLTAGDELIFYLARLGDDVADTSVGDFVVTLLTVEIGRS